ncbi:hypothetical protein DFH94DRAFT_355407 [Russula ochroleuca]|uniref:Secreted protein n=1 Tax=Russula ochroleuca TaxID=152965 RepID=A0A9P5MPR4_9AGAM|nr:hypothetical protein DFH94DRAFT_355407 [Russula ochroleuca]
MHTIWTIWMVQLVSIALDPSCGEALCVSANVNSWTCRHPRIRRDTISVRTTWPFTRLRVACITLPIYALPSLSRYIIRPIASLVAFYRRAPESTTSVATTQEFAIMVMRVAEMAVSSGIRPPGARTSHTDVGPPSQHMHS